MKIVNYHDIINYVKYNEIDKIETLDKPYEDIVFACVRHNNIEFLQKYISKFDDGNNVLISDYMMHVFFDYERTDMIKLLMKNNIKIICELDYVDDIDQLRKRLECCHNNNFIYVYTDELMENLSRLGIIADSEEIFSQYNLEYKINKRCVNHATIESIDWLYKKYKLGQINFEYSYYAIQNAINTNSIELLKWWIDHSDEFELKYDNLTLYRSDYEILNFLLNEQDTIKINITSEVIFKGFINYDFQVEDIDILKLDCLYDALIKNNSIFQYDNPFIGSVKILNWLYDKFKAGQFDLKYTKNNFINNVAYNYIECIKWWFDHSDEFNFDHIVIDENDYYENRYNENDYSVIYEDSSDFDNKLFMGDMSIKSIKYVYFEQKNIKMIPNSKMIDRLFDTNRSHIIELIDLFYHNRHLNENGFDYTHRAIDYCQEPEYLKWWLKHMNELELKYTSISIDQLLRKYYSKENYLASREKWYECLKFWCDNRFVIQPKFTRDLLVQYLNDDPDEQLLRVLLD
jgi:hypothetical protein